MVNDLFTEITQDSHVIPDTASVTLLGSANVAADVTAKMANITQLINLLIAILPIGPRCPYTPVAEYGVKTTAREKRKADHAVLAALVTSNKVP